MAATAGPQKSEMTLVQYAQKQVHGMGDIAKYYEVQKNEKNRKKSLDNRGVLWYYKRALPTGGANGNHTKRNLLRIEKSS